MCAILSTIRDPSTIREQTLHSGLSTFLIWTATFPPIQLMVFIYLFQQATATCHKNKMTVYFESHSSLYTHGNEASVHPSTDAT